MTITGASATTSILTNGGTWNWASCSLGLVYVNFTAVTGGGGKNISIADNITVTSFTISVGDSITFAVAGKTVTGTLIILGQTIVTDIQLELPGTDIFDAENCNCGVTGRIYSKDHNGVAGDFVAVLAGADIRSFSEITTEPASGDRFYIYLEIGQTASTFNFDEAAKTLGLIQVQTGKTVTTGFSQNLTLNGSFVNSYIVNVTGTAIVTQTATGADAYATFVSNASSGWTIAAGAKWVLVGTAAYHCYVRETGRATVGGDGIITDLGPTNSIGVTGGTLQGTYTHFLHMRLLLKASSLVLTDSEYWFTVGTEPEEQIQAGTWTLVRSLIAAYDNKRWYVKPTGTISLTDSYLDGCIPTIYSSNYYIVFYQTPTKILETSRPRIEAEDSFLGGLGEYSEVTGYKSSYVDLEGRLSMNDLALWDHPLDHRILAAMSRQLSRAQAEIVKLTWNEGHYPKATIFSVNFEQFAGEGWHQASRTYKIVIKERPYN
jgi:hypothetical protein